MKKVLPIICICTAILVAAGMVWIPQSGDAASPVIETHQYEPVAAGAEESEAAGHGNFCSKDSCELVSAVRGGEAGVISQVNAEVKDVNLTTEERDECVEKGNLESTIISRAAASFSDTEGGSGADSFAVTGVSGVDTIKYLTPDDGYVGCTVKLDISGGGGKGFIETNVYVTYVESTDEQDDKEADKDSDTSDEDDTDNDVTVDNDDDSSGGNGGGIIDNGSSTKKKSTDKKKIKENTAKITAKEREKDKAIAVAPGENGEDGNGPDPLTISLFALAAVIAAVFYRWIRSDLKIIKWHEQKKALRKP